MNQLNLKDLTDLEKFLDIDDTNLYNYYNGLDCDFEFKENYINSLFKNSSMIVRKINGGRTEIRTQERVAPLPVFKTGAFNHSAILP